MELCSYAAKRSDEERSDETNPAPDTKTQKPALVAVLLHLWLPQQFILALLFGQNSLEATRGLRNTRSGKSCEKNQHNLLGKLIRPSGVKLGGFCCFIACCA